MAELGQINTLNVNRVSPIGCVLDGERLGDIMLVPGEGTVSLTVGDAVDVFVYRDADEALMATTTMPKVVANQLASLDVVSLTNKGAYLDWGLRFDLFVPRSEQLGDMRVGQQCVVYAMLDANTERMIATARLHEHLSEYNNDHFTSGQTVDVLVCQKTSLGYRVAIEGTHLGMTYHSEIFSQLNIGDRLQAYIKAVRDDDKLDLALQPPGRKKIEGVEAAILDYLQQNNGEATVTDKSPPAEIYQQFGVSKKVFKQAVGALYKARLITVSKTHIKLVQS